MPKMSKINLARLACLANLACLTRLGIALYVFASLAYLFLGQVNGDEGWYLYTSKLIVQGALPFRDLAYTQMPLFPYVYGVLQIVQPSMYVGRLTSILIAFGALLMSVIVARRYAGARGGSIAAWLGAAFTCGVYFNSIVKTYALVSFFFVATLFVLSSNLRAKYPLAILFALASVMVRITALAFLAPILAYVWIGAPRWRTRALVLLECGVAILVAGFFLLPDWQAARWGLFDSHLRHWAGAGISTQINFVLSQRVTDIIQNFGLLLMLFAAAGFFLWREQGWNLFRGARAPLWVATLGLGLFAAAHLPNGLWSTEYLVPAVSAALPILAILLSQVYDALEDRARVFWQGVVLAALIFLPLTESIQHVDFTGRRLPLAEVDEVAACIARNSQPADQVLALEALSAVVNANRSTLPGLTLAQFSAQLMDTPTAQRFRVVNVAMLAEMTSQARAKIVVLTERDFGLLDSQDVASANALRRALDQQYNLVMTMPLFGQYARPLFVYLLRE